MGVSSRPVLVVVFILAASSQIRADEDARSLEANRAELNRLQGDWTIVGAIREGQEFDARGLDEFARLKLVFTIKNDSLTVSSDGHDLANLHAVVRLNANYNPKILDFAVKSEDREAAVEGVYSVDGDKLTWCVNVDGDNPAKGQRPPAIESKEGSNAIVLKFERQKN
jgi:uncharacterized protein (TIGR03067 family)